MNQPKLITTPFAQDAPSSAVDEIPETLAPSDPIQNASWSVGFPNVTMIPLAAGGIPPRGQSMNGVLKAISEHSAFVGGGGQYKWDQDWVDAKGGYAKGAVLQSDDGLASYVSAVDNNTDNFNTDPASIGASWLPYSGAVKIDSAGTGLIQDGTALRVNFGTTAGTAAQGNDSRITGAMQKSANLGDVNNANTARNNLGLGTAATANLTTSNADGTAGRVLKVGDGGWMGQGAASIEPLGYPTSMTDTTNQTKVIRSQTPDNGVFAYASGIHFSALDTWGRLRVQHNVPNAWLQGGSSTTGSGWTSRIVLSDNLLQSTGQSTRYPMSQKAVTDALGALGQPSMTGSATLNGTTDNAVDLTDIVTELALEVGDVIRIDTGAYNKLHTVESITNNGSIIVNYEHAGNRGDGSLKLPDFTGQATVTRIAKWFNAPIGLGQAWVVFKARAIDPWRDRLIGATVTYMDGRRPMQVIINIDWTTTAGETDGLEVDGAAVNTADGGGNFVLQAVCKSYKINFTPEGYFYYAAELR